MTEFESFALAAAHSAISAAFAAQKERDALARVTPLQLAAINKAFAFHEATCSEPIDPMSITKTRGELFDALNDLSRL